VLIVIRNLVILAVLGLLLSRCSYVKQSYFLKDCSRSESDDVICKCTFKAIDPILNEQIGSTWVFRPDLGRYPEFYKALEQSERQCPSPYYQ
jgi:hypothetical protein